MPYYVNQHWLIVHKIQSTELLGIGIAAVRVKSGEGHSGIFWVGMCHPGLQIGIPRS